ncbi:MAG: hypothetical protein OEY85_14560 [Rhodospirillales bacterium]|nr:hypothetical protein [Rhodospirillales bacterium]
MSIRSVFLILAAGVIFASAAFVLLQDDRSLRQRFLDHEMAASTGIAPVAAAVCAYDRVTAKHGDRAILHYLRIQGREKRGERITRSDKTLELGFLVGPELTNCAQAELLDKYMPAATAYRHPFVLGACNTTQRKGAKEDLYFVRCEVTNAANLPVRLLDGDILFRSKSTGATLFVIDLKIGLQFPPRGSTYGRINFKLTPERLESLGIGKGEPLSADIILRIRKISLENGSVVVYGE